MRDVKLFFVAGLLLILSSSFSLIFALESEKDFVDFFSQTIDLFFSSEKKPLVTFNYFENFSFLKNEELIKYYQLFAAVLEKKNRLLFKDNLLEFSGQKAFFNTQEQLRADFLLGLKFIQSGTKLGLGLEIFRRSKRQLVLFKYFEKELTAGERELLSFRSSPLLEDEFFEIQNFTLFEEILDVFTLKTEAQTLLFFLMADKIEVYKWENDRLKRVSFVNFSFEKVFLPAQIAEGKICFIQAGDKNYLAVGLNFYPDVFLFTVTGQGEIRFDAAISFLPLSSVKIGSQDYWLAVKYETSKNFFSNRLYFVNQSNQDEILKKENEPFYALAIIKKSSAEWSMFYINIDNRLKMINESWQSALEFAVKAGNFLDLGESNYLFLHEVEGEADFLKVYRYNESSLQLIAGRKIDGELRMLRCGWLDGAGIWVMVEKNRKKSVQFWKIKDV